MVLWNVAAVSLWPAGWPGITSGLNLSMPDLVRIISKKIEKIQTEQLSGFNISVLCLVANRNRNMPATSGTLHPAALNDAAALWLQADVFLQTTLDLTTPTSAWWKLQPVLAVIFHVGPVKYNSYVGPSHKMYAFYAISKINSLNTLKIYKRFYKYNI